jgi:hypothetical protein
MKMTRPLEAQIQPQSHGVAEQLPGDQPALRRTELELDAVGTAERLADAGADELQRRNAGRRLYMQRLI